MASKSDRQQLEALDPMGENIVLVNETQSRIKVDVFNKEDIARLIARRSHEIAAGMPCVSTGRSALSVGQLVESAMDR